MLDDLRSILQEHGLLDGRHATHDYSNHGRGHKICLTHPETARLEYLQAHLEALKSTLSVMLQTLYTAQIIIWARY